MTATWAESRGRQGTLGDPLAGVERPRGDSFGVQGLGGRYASGAADLTSSARQLMGLVGHVLGQSWTGAASAACAAACVRSAQAILLAAQAYENAGGALSTYGSRLAMAQAEYDSARHLADQAMAEEHAHKTAASAGLGAIGGGPQHQQFGDLFWRSPLRDAARARAEQAAADAATAARQASGVLDTAMAPLRPPGKDFDWSEQVAGFGQGVKDGVVQPVAMVGGLVGLNGDTGQNWSALGSGIGYGFTHPGDFVKGLVNWEDLEKGDYGHWLGELLPGAVATFFSGGAAAGVKGAEAAAAAQRVAEALKATNRVLKDLPGALKDVKVLVAVTPDGLRIPIGIDAAKLRQLLSEAAPSPRRWPVSEGVKGPAGGQQLKLPHWRHTLARVAEGKVKAKTGVILRGYEEVVREDIAQIAAGRAVWEEDLGRYSVNGRTYGVGADGKVFPDSGPGIASLSRDEYTALSELAKAGGDVDSVNAFKYEPRFRDNPQLIEKVKKIYDGTYTNDL